VDWRAGLAVVCFYRASRNSTESFQDFHRHADEIEIEMQDILESCLALRSIKLLGAVERREFDKVLEVAQNELHWHRYWSSFGHPAHLAGWILTNMHCGYCGLDLVEGLFSIASRARIICCQKVSTRSCATPA